MYIGKNQYVFSKENINSIEYAHYFRLGDYSLYIGDSCEHTICEYGDKKVCVLGIAVDVVSPEKSLEEMCYELVRTITIDTVGPQFTSNWCGRWVVVLCVSDQLFCWHDACGLKQVFYDVKFNVLASQARYIAYAKGCQMDDEALVYLECAKKADKEYALPVDTTLYADVKRLLPNHFIELKQNRIQRSNLRTSGNGINASAECADALRNAMSAAHRRKALAITLTAGWDSRLVLASCCDLNKDYEVVTLKYNWMTDDNEDIVVAGELCQNLGLPHKVLKCRDVDNSFEKRYVEHSENAHDYWMQMAQAIEDNGYADKLWVKGSCNEILRVTSGNLYNWQVNANIICGLFHLPKTKFSMDAINAWLASAKPYCKANGLRLLDLFYWEHRMGSWLAECANEADVVGEMFTPFNSRCYLCKGMNVFQSQRTPPSYEFMSSVICSMSETIGEISILHKYTTPMSYIKQIIKQKVPLLYGVFVLLRSE